MHWENLELSLKDREPVNASVTNFFSQNLNQGHNILAKWMLLKWWGLLSTWRQGRAHCTTWEELSHHRELVPSPPHESSLDSASWYKILFFLRNYSTCCESPLAVLLESFHDQVSSKGPEEAPGRTRLSWRWKLRLTQSGKCYIFIHCNKNTTLIKKNWKIPFLFCLWSQEKLVPPIHSATKAWG